MLEPQRFFAICALVLSTAAAAQPTLERTSCLHPLNQAQAGLGLALAAADWDDDGRDDLAYGTPFFDDLVGGEVENGRFGTFQHDPSAPTGWAKSGGTFGAADGDRRGTAVVAGDFDGDLLPEFAYSDPYDGGGTVTVEESTGGVCCQQLGIVLEQGTNGISGSSEEDDRFGASLAAGDFDDDGFDDLAVGVPGESWSGAAGEHQGAVHVFYGSSDGLDGTRDALYGQDEFTGQSKEADDQFGFALVAGDFDGDRKDDLAIGVPYENEGAIVDSGLAHVVYGGSGGVDFGRQRTWSQSSSGMASSPEAGDLFGWSLAVGDFDREPISPLPTRHDLVVSVPCEADGSIACAGAFHVLYGDFDNPLDGATSQFELRPGGSIANARFGLQLLGAHLDNDYVPDLAVGSLGPAYATPPGLEASGEVHLFHGREKVALRFSGRDPWRPTGGGECADDGVAVHLFGLELAAGDFDGDDRVDLAIGIPGWSDSGADPFKGAVQVLFGSLFADGFETVDSSRWSNVEP